MTEIEALRRQVADLQAQVDRLRHVIVFVTDIVKPPRVRHILLALSLGITAEQQRALDAFWKWVAGQDLAAITGPDVVRVYDARMPQPLQGKLPDILRAYRADGYMAPLCALVLGADEGTDDDAPAEP